MPLSGPITSRSNARVKALRASFVGGASAAGELVGLEGEHLVGEALRSGLKLEAVFVRQGNERVLERASLAGIKSSAVVVLSADVFASAVETTSPQGIAAMVRIPETLPVGGESGLVLVLEALQDPGNLGTLLRSAEAFGASLVMVTPETANVWGPKVVRASAGSVFRVPVVRAQMKQIVQRLAMLKLRVFAAVPRGNGAVMVTEAYLGAPCAVMIGNEGAGLSSSTIAMADVLLTIPCAVESLNAAVAGSVILYEALRQRSLKGEAKR